MAKKRFFTIFALSIAALIAAFAIVDVILNIICSQRAIYGVHIKDKIAYLQGIAQNSSQRENHTCERDEDLGLHYIPNSEGRLITSEFSVRYSINSQGLRDSDSERLKKDGIFRIVALGDSFTFGEGVNYGSRYTEIIEQALDNVEVINMGVQAFGIDQSLLLLEKEGFKYHPDLVILFMNRPNLERCGLFFCSAYKPRFELDANSQSLLLKKPFRDKGAIQDTPEPLLQVSEIAHRNKAAEGGILDKSAIFNIVKYKIYKTRIEKELERQDRLFWEKNNKAFADINKNKITGEELDKVIFLILDRYRKACSENNTRLLVINTDVAPLSVMDAYCKDHTASYYDLSRVLSQASVSHSLFYRIDPHYNEYAHRLIGERVSAYLSEAYHLRKDEGFVYTTGKDKSDP